MIFSTDGTQRVLDEEHDRFGDRYNKVPALLHCNADMRDAIIKQVVRSSGKISRQKYR